MSLLAFSVRPLYSLTRHYLKAITSPSFKDDKSLLQISPHRVTGTLNLVSSAITTVNLSFYSPVFILIWVTGLSSNITPITSTVDRGGDCLINSMFVNEKP